MYDKIRANPLIDKLYRNYKIYGNSSGTKSVAVCKIFTPGFKVCQQGHLLNLLIYLVFNINFQFIKTFFTVISSLLLTLQNVIIERDTYSKIENSYKYILSLAEYMQHLKDKQPQEALLQIKKQKSRTWRR